MSMMCKLFDYFGGRWKFGWKISCNQKKWPKSSSTAFVGFQQILPSKSTKNPWTCFGKYTSWNPQAVHHSEWNEWISSANPTLNCKVIALIFSQCQSCDPKMDLQSFEWCWMIGGGVGWMTFQNDKTLEQQIGDGPLFLLIKVGLSWIKPIQWNPSLGHESFRHLGILPTQIPWSQA